MQSEKTTHGVKVSLQQHYSITIDRERRQLRPSVQYTNIVTYALVIAKSVEYEPFRCMEAEKSKEPVGRVAAMNKKMEPILKDKFKHCLDWSGVRRG